MSLRACCAALALFAVCAGGGARAGDSTAADKHWKMARAYLERGMRGHAEEEARIVLRLDPGHAAARELLAVHATRTPAVKVPAANTPESSAEPATLLTEAKRAYRESRVEDAGRLAGSLLQTDPLNAGALAIIRNLKEEEYVESPLAVDDSLRALFDQGMALYRREEWEPAAGFFQRGTALSPSHEQTWRFFNRSRTRGEEAVVSRGLARAKEAIAAGRIPEAKAELRRVLEAKPDNAEARALLESLGEDAQAAARRARIRAHFNLGAEAYEQGRYADAVREWETVTSLDPADAETARLLKKARGKQASALKAARKRIPGLRAKALRLYQLGKMDEAQKFYREILDLDPQDEKARRALEMIEKREAYQ